MDIDQDEIDRDDFLQELVDGDYLEGAALGITKLLIDEGDDALSDKQKYVFKRAGLDVFVTSECKVHGSAIPWSEMMIAYENGGLCGYCQNTIDKTRND